MRFDRISPPIVAAVICSALASAPLLAQSLVATDFSTCDQPLPVSRSGVDLEPAEVLHLLEGVWLGHRETPEGHVSNHTYAMIFDSTTSSAFVIEDTSHTENAFAEFFERPGADAPRWTFLTCSGGGLPPHRDVFVRVSEEPRFDVLTKVTGAKIGTEPKGEIDAFAAVAKTGWFEKGLPGTRQGAHLAASVSPVSDGKLREVEVRFDGKYRDNEGRTPLGSDQTGVEMAMFQAVSSDAGFYLVSPGSNGGGWTITEELTVDHRAAGSAPQIVTAEIGNRLVASPEYLRNDYRKARGKRAYSGNFSYHRVVLGPFPAPKR